MELSEFVRDINPEQTILLFGAGSSLPSNAPTPKAIIDHLSKQFSISSEGFNLAEFTELVEQRSKDRRRMIIELRSLFKGLRPTAGLLNLPLYDWKSIYTTNYDNLVELSYERKKKTLGVVNSNFDFGNVPRSANTRLYKLHGTIEKDVAFGDQARLIITQGDYTLALDFREFLFKSLESDLSEANLIIIGSSLSDEDIKPLITKAIQLNSKAMVGGRITLLMYQRDDGRADLYRGQGLNVVFGGIDDFSTEMARKSPGPLFDYQPTDSILEAHPTLVATVFDVKHQVETGSPDISRMFNGWPASYADIVKGLTFERSLVYDVSSYIQSETGVCITVVGASGVGKTTGARQTMISLLKAGYVCWEHQSDFSVDPDEWAKVAQRLQKTQRRGVLLIDEAHQHLREINELVDKLAAANSAPLTLLLVSTRNNWKPRVKSPNIHKKGKVTTLSKIGSEEIERLLSLVDNNPDIAKIVETSFWGFNRAEKRRRLTDRCESDMFVCMRNIFASESFDDIILREFAGLDDIHQDVYRHVAALENAGIKVHRQLIIRLIGIPMNTIMSVLDSMTDIISEYSSGGKQQHIYAWRGRHPVISAIVASYKYNDVGKLAALFDNVIDIVSPAYDIEVRSMIELCNVQTGIPNIPDKEVQNRLLRKMISVLPGQRVPRHRLIRNLTSMCLFEQAQTEIRIFEKDFKADAPVARLKVELLVARATESEGLLLEDRVAILVQAKELAIKATNRHANSSAVFGAYCNVGLNILKYANERETFDDAMGKLKRAQERLADPEIGHIVRRYERLEANVIAQSLEGYTDGETLGEIED